MDTRYDDWVRHFDGLQWTVTSILLAADAALLAYMSDPARFRTFLALGGLALTFVAVVLASSMRELRQRFQAELDKPTRDLISVGRRRYLYQWPYFIALFVGIQAGWTWLLISHSARPWWLWVSVGAVAAVATAVVGGSVNSPRVHSHSERAPQSDTP